MLVQLLASAKIYFEEQELAVGTKQSSKASEAGRQKRQAGRQGRQANKAGRPTRQAG